MKEMVAVPGSENPAPHFGEIDGRRALFVDGAPFTVLTVEIPWKRHFFGRYHETVGAYDEYYPIARELGLNALKVPVKWSQIEPVEGEYDFSYVDHVIKTARQNRLRIVLGWFGHYASGDGSLYRNLTSEVFAPMYVIEDDHRFPRAVDATGVVHHNSASYAYPEITCCETAAFSALMQHLCEIDEGIYTVLMIQVENEIAVFGFDRQNRIMWRDHSPAAEEHFSEWDDDLSFSARLMARKWLNPITTAGRAQYDLPMFCNFVGGLLADHIVGGSPGEDVSIYLKECPNIDFIGLNYYVDRAESVNGMRATLDRYRADRNIVAITETNSDGGPVMPRLCFDSIARYGVPIFAPWALNISYPMSHEPYVDAGGRPAHGAERLRETYTALSAAMGIVSTFAGTSRIVAVVPHQPGEPAEGVVDLHGREVRYSCSADGQLLVVYPAQHEFVIIGYRGSVTIPTPAALWPACREILAERGRFGEDRWISEGESEWVTFNQSTSAVSVSLSRPAAVRLRLPE